MDLFLFWKINALVGISSLLDWLGIFLSGKFAWLVGLAIIAFALKEKWWKEKDKLIVLIGSPLLSRLVLTELIRFFLHRARPAVALETAKKLIEIWPSERFNSFPSGHATFFFALAMAVYFYNKKAGIALFTVATIIGLAKIFVSAHWPSDVLAGAIIGVASAWLVKFFVYKSKSKNLTKSVG